MGKLQIMNPKKRTSIVAALIKGIENGKEMAKCFWPRHGIKATKNGKTVEFVVCIECSQLEIHSGFRLQRKAIAPDPQAVFNKHLTDADDTLAPTK